MDLRRVLRDLIDEKKRLERAILALQALEKGSRGKGRRRIPGARRAALDVSRQDKKLTRTLGSGNTVDKVLLFTKRPGAQKQA
jgi:hypothetical protein